SSTENCYKWAIFNTTIRVQNFLPNSDKPSEETKKPSSKDTQEMKSSSQKFFVEIRDTHLMLRPGSLDQSMCMFLDYNESIKRLRDAVKKSRDSQLENNETIKSLMKTGEKYYSYYSNKIVKTVTNDPTIFISSGFIRVINTTLSLPIGDNPYYGFLSGLQPSFKPSTTLQFVIQSISLSILQKTNENFNPDSSNVKSKILGSCKVNKVCLYFEEMKSKKLYEQVANLSDFNSAKNRCMVDTVSLGMQITNNQQLLRGIADVKVSGPEIRSDAAISTHILSLLNDWWNPKRKLYR